MVQPTLTPGDTPGASVYQAGWDADTWFSALCQRHPEQTELLRRAWDWLHQRAADTGAPSCVPRRCGSLEILDQLLNLDVDTLVAALLADERDPARLAHDLPQQFGSRIAHMVEGVARMDLIHELQSRHSPRTQSPEQTEKLRKMLLAMAEDARVVLIKLAECLHDMRSLSQAPPAEQRLSAREVLEVYAPLANRLGIWKIKWELEDLAFRYLHPETYQKLAGLLEDRRGEREAYIQNIADQLQATLAANGVQAQISGRPKHIYSIWRKMQRKGLEFHQLYDVLALRALVNSVNDCYLALGAIHSAWQPIKGEFDDYIAAPKPNGYKSLHTAVLGPEDKPFEVQVRTLDMHRLSEFGVASHWRYKEGVKHDNSFEQKIAWLRQVLQSKEEDADEADSGADILNEFNSEIAEERVYALTPQGRIVDLPQGATPLDFAYAVHTNLGHRCRGAKVNNKIVPLSYNLKTGDQVEVISANQERPSRDWLNPGQNYLKSSRSIAKVRQWFKRQDNEQHLSDGRNLLERELRRLGLGQLNLELLAQRFHYANPSELYLALGRNELGTAQIASALKEQVLPEEPPLDAGFHLHGSRAKDSAGEVQVQGVDGLLTHMAGCCKPVPPDPLVGYITRGQGVTIHRRDCPQVLHLRETEHERLLEVEWSQPGVRVYPVDVEIEAYDRTGLLRDIGNVLSADKINITAVSTGNRPDADPALVRAKLVLSIEIRDMRQLSQVLSKLEQLAGVMRVRRKGSPAG